MDKKGKKPKAYKHLLREAAVRELSKAFYCGSCTMGFADLEEFRHHYNDDEEHKYHEGRRAKIMEPGMGYCAACSIIIQTAKYWKMHLEKVKEGSEVHKKCIESLRAIGKTDDYSLPLGCVVSGQLGFPIHHSKVNARGSRFKGQAKACNDAGQPIIGLNFVKQLFCSGSYDEQFLCEVCDTTFNFKGRMVHLSSQAHRRSYLEKYYSEWHEDVMKIPTDTVNKRVTNRLIFYAHKIDQLEKKNETSDAKALREKFFNVDNFLQNRDSGLNRGKPEYLRKFTGRPGSQRPGSQPLDLGPQHQHIHGPTCFEAPSTRPDDSSLGYDPTFGDHIEPLPSPKRFKSDTSSGQYEYDHEEEYYQPEGPPRHPHMGRGRGSSRGSFGPPLHGPRRPSGPPRPPAPHRLPGPRGPPAPPQEGPPRYSPPQDVWDNQSF